MLLESGSNFNAAERGELTVSNPIAILVAVESPSLVEHLKAVQPLPVETMERCVLENKSVIHSFTHSFTAENESNVFKLAFFLRSDKAAIRSDFLLIGK